MSFYVTLPSNSSLAFFPNNTLSNYTTKLHADFDLEGKYEVALTEIMFPFNWKYRQDGFIIFTTFDKSKIEKFEIKFYAYDYLNELITNINAFTKRKAISFEMFYNKFTHIVSISLNSPWQIEFTDGIHKQLGLAAKKYQGQDKINKFYGTETISVLLNKINALYVYTDIVDFQYVGDAFAPLLRVVAVDASLNQTFGEYVNKIFATPNYIPVSKNKIDTIDIDIRSDTGEKVQLSSGKVFIKLHFRQQYQ